jgi:phosphatidate cytidylyltransferase
MMNKKLVFRIASGLIMLIFCLWAIFATTEFLFFLITFSLALAGSFEYHLIIKKHIKLNLMVQGLNHVLMFASVWFLFQNNHTYFIISIITNIALLIGSGFITRSSFKWYCIPVVWISFPFCLLFWIRVNISPDIAPHLILLILLMVSINDSAAYFGGKTFGKTLLAPNISPKKTKEGSLFGILGGLIGALIGIYLWDCFYLSDQFGSGKIQLKELFFGWKLVALVLLVVPAAQIGDLIESKLKRTFNVKDSSNFIPGHGGFLDRYDAYLVAIPVYFILLMIYGLSG